MIVHPFTPGTFRTMYPSGRSYLFDMGAGHWDEGSLTWFITVWGRRGVVFDEIYGARTSPAAHAPVTRFLSRAPMVLMQQFSCNRGVILRACRKRESCWVSSRMNA